MKLNEFFNINESINTQKILDSMTKEELKFICYNFALLQADDDEKECEKILKNELRLAKKYIKIRK